jgi:two-component sensor histidine kinase
LQERSALDDVALADLVDSVARGVGSLWGRAIHVESAPDCKPCVVDATEAVPLALILNELLSNALKHGEPTDRVTLALGQGDTPASVHVAIRNAGKLPSDFDFERDSGTGLQLVKSLMPGHGANVSWEHQDHAVVATLELRPPVIILRT